MIYMTFIYQAVSSCVVRRASSIVRNIFFSKNYSQYNWANLNQICYVVFV